jgi:hypothetical protein
MAQHSFSAWLKDQLPSILLAAVTVALLFGAYSFAIQPRIDALKSKCQAKDGVYLEATNTCFSRKAIISLE